MNSINDRTRPPSKSEARWAIVRLVLGLAQMMGATVSAMLLIQLGINEWSLGAVILTCLCTALSILLFRVRWSRPPTKIDSETEPE